VAFGVAFLLDKRSWRFKPTEELQGMIASDDWRFHYAAIKELRRRGEDVDRYLPGFLADLAAPSVHSRAAADMVIRKFFSQVVPEMGNYSPYDEKCREAILPLIEKHVFPES
jgi:hypothetical protein